MRIGMHGMGFRLMNHDHHDDNDEGRNESSLFVYPFLSFDSGPSLTLLLYISTQYTQSLT